VARALVVRTETCHGAVDDRPRNVVRPDSEAVRDPRSKAFEDDVRTPAQSAAELRVASEVPHDGLLAGVDRRVPTWSHRTKRVSLRRLDPHDPRSALQQFATRERAGEVPREVDDQDVAQHHRPTLTLDSMLWATSVP
jgi:hypothetical protein